jgi:23S rRNA (adenine2503-C2)-methyltransferase
VGITPVIREIADAKYKFNLAISLITADDEKRSDLMPFNRKYTLKDIISAIKYYNKKTERKVTIEYILFDGINDSEEDAEKLLKALRGTEYMVNLIPYNSVSGREFSKPIRDKTIRFQTILIDAGKKAFIRREKGSDIAAACGQMAGKNLAK